MSLLSRPSKLDFQERLVETVETLSTVPPVWYWLLAIVVVAAVPGVFVLQLVFINLIKAEYPTPPLTYIKPQAQDIQVVDKQLVRLPEGTYYGFARISNPNSDLAVRQLGYQFSLKAADGSVLASQSGNTYLLSAQDKLLFLPPQDVSGTPVSLELKLTPEHWSKIRDLENLNFTFEQQMFGRDVYGQYYVSGVMHNESPYLISAVDLGILLYNLKRETVGANFTVLNDVKPGEKRFFRTVWPKDVNYPDTVNVEFKPSVNQLQKGVLLTENIPGNIDAQAQ